MGSCIQTGADVETLSNVAVSAIFVSRTSYFLMAFCNSILFFLL